MATKIKLLRLMQEVRGYALITNRRPAPRPSVHYLMQMRERGTPASTPKRRLTVVTDSPESVTTSLPIKINHVKLDESAFPMVLC